MIDLIQPDLNTHEGASKAIRDVTAAARELQADNAALRTQLGALTKDLITAQQALVEQGRPRHVADGPETELRAFVREDGKLRAIGEPTPDQGWCEGLLDSKPVCRWQEELQEAVETRNLVRAIKGRRLAPHQQGAVSQKSDARIAKILARAPDSIRRAFGDIATAGAEWYPDVMLPVLERELTLARRMAGLFQEMPMSAKNVLLPFLTTGFRPYLKAAVGGDDPSQYPSSSMVTAQRAVDAVGFAVRSQLDEEATEDSLIDSMPLIRQELLVALVDGEEDCLLNGDTTATHQDTIASWDIRSRWGTSGLGAASDHRRAWIGLRPRATDVSNTADGSSVETTAGIITARGSLASPHGATGSLVIVTSPEWYLLKMIGLAEVLTVDKFGPNATIYSGQLASFLGMPVIMTEFMGADMNASGVYDNVTKTKTGFLIFNKDRFKIGRRRGSSVEIDKDITRGIYNLVGTVREVFFTMDSSTKKNVRYNYNLTAS